MINVHFEKMIHDVMEVFLEDGYPDLAKAYPTDRVVANVKTHNPEWKGLTAEVVFPHVISWYEMNLGRPLS